MKTGYGDAPKSVIDGSRDRKITFDRVANSAPIDLTARIVASEGVHYDPFSKGTSLNELWFKDCPPLKSRDKEGGYVNLVGLKTGILTCVGYFGKGLWVMRCACGRFKLKRARKVRLAGHDRCAVCRNTAILRNGGESGGVDLRKMDSL